MSPRRPQVSAAGLPPARRRRAPLWIAIAGAPLVLSTLAEPAASSEPAKLEAPRDRADGGRGDGARGDGARGDGARGDGARTDGARSDGGRDEGHAAAKGEVIPPLPAEYVTEEVGWLRIGYHPSARDRLRVVMPRLDEMRAELREMLGADVLESVELRIAALDAEMVRLTPGEVAPTGRGQTFDDAHLVVLSAGAASGGDAQDLESAIRYQLARLALTEAVTKPPALPSDQDGAGGARSSPEPHRPSEVPAWFEEGFAVHFARSYEANRTETLLFAWVRNELPHVAELGSPGPGTRDPRAEGAAFAADFVRFVSDARDRSTLPEVVAKLRRGEHFDDAVAEALGSDRAGVDRAWRQDMAKRYALFPVVALSLVLWAALWLVGLVRRKRAIAASESTAARLRERRRNRASDASALIVVSRARRDATPLLDGAPRRDDEVQHDGVYADGPAPAPSSDRRRTVDPAPREIEVPKIEHEGDWHTLH